MLEGLISKMNQYHHQPLVPVMEDSLSNLTSASGEASNSSINPSVGEAPNLHPPPLHPQEKNPPPNKKKRSLPGNPDPDSEVIALSPKSLLAKNRFLCEICNKGFQRDQNLQLHRRGHNLPWKLKQRSKTEVVRRKVYVCPETSCVHHDPSRALGDLTGIKKHFCRKHGEKKWKCEKCSKKYAVQSDWKAHSKICGTREYRCDCGTLFSRRDSFITHRAFCDVLAEEAARSTASNPLLLPTPPQQHHHHQQQQQQMPRHHYNQYQQIFSSDQNSQLINAHDLHPPFLIKQESPQQQSQSFNLIPPWLSFNQGSMQAPLQRNPSHGLLGGPTSCFGAPSSSPSSFLSQSSPQMSATALLHKAAQIGATMSSKITQAQQDQFQFPATSAGQQGPHDHVSAILTSTPTTTTAGFGLNLSPQDHHQQQQEMMNNAINNINCSDVVNGGSNFPSSSSPSLLLHDLMMNSLSSSFDGDDNPFANGGNDGLTRDFLGLRPISTSDILSFAGFGNSMANLDGAANNVSSSSVSHQDDLHDKSWQG